MAPCTILSRGLRFLSLFVNSTFGAVPVMSAICLKRFKIQPMAPRSETACSLLFVLHLRNRKSHECVSEPLLYLVMAQFAEFLSQSPLQLQLRSALAAARRVRREVALLLIDIDPYPGSTHEWMNRTHLLQQALLHIRGALRESDPTFQMEGGRLAVLLLSVRGSDDAVVVARKILLRSNGRCS